MLAIAFNYIISIKNVSSLVWLQNIQYSRTVIHVRNEHILHVNEVYRSMLCLSTQTLFGLPGLLTTLCLVVHRLWYLLLQLVCSD